MSLIKNIVQAVSYKIEVDKFDLAEQIFDCVSGAVRNDELPGSRIVKRFSTVLRFAVVLYCIVLILFVFMFS